MKCHNKILHILLVIVIPFFAGLVAQRNKMEQETKNVSKHDFIILRY